MRALCSQPWTLEFRLVTWVTLGKHFIHLLDSFRFCQMRIVEELTSWSSQVPCSELVAALIENGAMLHMPSLT